MEHDFVRTIQGLLSRVEQLEKERGSAVIQPSGDIFEMDGNGDYMPYYPVSLFEFDHNGDYMPTLDGTDDSDFELDFGNNIMPRA